MTYIRKQEKVEAVQWLLIYERPECLKYVNGQGWFAGLTLAKIGDWIITTEDGFTYACKNDVFKRIYEQEGNENENCN